MEPLATRLVDEIAHLERLIRDGSYLLADGVEDPGAELMLGSLRARCWQVRAELAAERRRCGVTSLLVRLGGDAARDAALPLGVLAPVLGAAQSIVSSLGQTVVGETSRQGPISDQVLSGTALRFAGVHAGSFEAELLADTGQQVLGGGSVVERSICELHSLIEIGAETRALAAASERLGPRVLGAYRRLLLPLASNQISLSVESWPGGQELRRSQASARDAEAIVSALAALRERSQERRVLRGHLSGMRQQKEDFELVDTGSGHVTIGRIAADAIESAVMHFDQKVEVTLLVDLEPVRGTDFVKETFTLIGVTSVAQ